MTRSIFGVVAVAAGMGIFAGPGCKTTGVGDPCVPEQEYNAEFTGFDKGEVSVESKSFQCQTRLCLVNHFQGRVTCQYGQGSDKSPKDGTTGCFLPGSDNKATVEGDPDSPTKAEVKAQCADRTADETVYCSCRCANLEGRTDDGQNYCTCPDGFACTQLVTSIGKGDTGLTGGYCVKSGTEYNSASPGCTQLCGTGKECPGPQVLHP